MGRGRGPVQVGSGIKVYWDGDDTWYSAEVTEFDSVTEWCKVLYEDGEREEFRLSEVKFKRIWGGKSREKNQGKDPGRFSKKRLRYIHNTLVDMADRLPEFAVRRDSRQWWEEWQDSVKKAAYSRSLSGLVKLTSTFGEQIKVLDIEGKVDVTTAWWKAQSGEWQAKLKEAANYEDVASRVKDLLLRAVDWTAARNLFATTGDKPITMKGEEDTMGKETKRKGVVSESLAPPTTDQEVLKVEEDAVSGASPASKRRKITKKTLGEVTKDTDRRDKEESSQAPSVLGSEVHPISKITKKRRTGDGTKGKSTSVQVQKDYRILDWNSRISSIPPCNHIGPTGIISRGSEGNSCNLDEECQEAQVRMSKSEKFISETCFSGTVAGGKKRRGRKKKKKLLDAGNLNAGNLGKTFLLSEAHDIEKAKRGRKKIEHAASLAEFMHSDDEDEGIIEKGGAISSVIKEQSQLKEGRDAHEGDRLVANGSAAAKIVANANEDSEATVSALKANQILNPAGETVSALKQKNEVPEATDSKTRLEFKRKRGRPRKLVTAHVEVEVVKSTDQADLETTPRALSPKAAEVQDKQYKGSLKLDKMEEQALQDDSQIKDSCPSHKSDKGVGGQEIQVRQKKRGRPRKMVQPQLMDSQLNRDIISHAVGVTTVCKDVVMVVEDADPVRPRKRGRPRKSELHEASPVPLQSLSPPYESGNGDEEYGFLVEPVTQRLLLCTAAENGDDANVTSTRQEGAPHLVDKSVVDADAVGSTQENSEIAASTKVNDGAEVPIVTSFTPTLKKRGRPRKLPVQVECASIRKVASPPTPPSSPILPSVLKEDNSKSETLVSYKRRARSFRNSAGSLKISKVASVGEEKSHKQPPEVARLHVHDEVAKNASTATLMSSTSEEEQPEIAFGTSRTGSPPFVAEDAPVSLSKPVAAEDAERKYSRRHFRKSPGRPPRKVVQDEPQEDLTCPSISQSAAKPVALVDSEPEPQTLWTEVHLTSGKDVGTGSIYSKSQLFPGAGLSVVVEEQGKGELYQSVVREAEEATVCPARNRDTTTGCKTSLRRFRRHGSTVQSQTLQIMHNVMEHGAVPSSIQGDLHHDGRLIVANETSVVKTRKTRKSGETGNMSEMRRRRREGGPLRTTSTEVSGKNGLLSEDVQSVHLVDPGLITTTMSTQKSDGKTASNEVQLEQQPQAANVSLQVREAPDVKICELNTQSQSEVRLPSASSNQLGAPSLEEKSCANLANPHSDKPDTERRHDVCEEPVKIQERTEEICTAVESEAEPEYPSWGERLCSDSEDEFETIPVCAEPLKYNNETVESSEQEPPKATVLEETLTTPTEGLTSVLEQRTAGSAISELTVPVDVTPQGLDTCVLDKVSNVVVDIASESGQLNGRQALVANQAPNQDTKCVPPELVCNICNFKDAEDQMLLCEDAQERGCTCAIHTFCLNPPLQRVPTDAWTCLHCALMATHKKNMKICSPKRFPPKRIQAVIGRRSNLVKDELKRTEHTRMEYLVKWDCLSHKHDTWIDATWFVGERKRYASTFESKHPDLPKIDVTKEIDNTLVDERKPEWLLIDRILKCRGKSHLHPFQLPGIEWNSEGVQFLVKWQGLDYRYATWEEANDSKEMQAAVSAYILRHESAEKDLISPRLGESVATSISRQPDYIHGGSNSMYGYQIQGLKWLLSNFEARRNVILADEMGLGKTIQAIAFMSCVRNEKLSSKPGLVIAPKSTLSGWEQELKLWAPGLNAVVYQGEKDNRFLIRKYEFYTHNKRPLFEVLLTSYELATLDNSLLCKFHWSSIIVDEGHRMRNMRSKLGIVLKEQQAEFRILLTGTPVQNTLVELFSLFHFLDPVKFPDPDSAAQQFTEAVDDGNASSVDSGEKSKQLSRFQELLKPRMLRRVKNEVPGLRIPGKKIIQVPCILTDLQRHLYMAILKKNLKVLNSGVQSGLKRSLNNILTDLKMVCNHPYLFPEKEPHGLKPEEASRMMVDVSGKLLFLEKLLPLLKEGGHRVLLFSQMTKMLDIIEDFLTFMGLSFLRIDGTTSAADRQKSITDFNHPESSTFIFLISTRAGGLGINLPSADTVIIYDPDFNPFVDIQAQARAHRIGQEKVVLVYQLVTEFSVEEKILERCRKKLAMENLVMTSGLKGPNQTKDTAADISTVLLHGLNHVLDEQHVRATCTEHTTESVRKLLDRSTSGSSLGDEDSHGYLGAVQGHDYVIQDAGKEAEDYVQGGYGAKWRELLSKLVEQDEKEELGRGKRTRKQVKYSVQQNVEGQEEGQEDDEYTPTSSSDESGSDVSLEAEGSKSSPVPRKTADLVLEVGQEEEFASRRGKSPGSSVPKTEVAGRPLPTFATTSPMPVIISPSLHRGSMPGVLGTLSSPIYRQSGTAGSPGLGAIPPTQRTGTYIPISGAIYERVVSSQGIGIHLNRLLSPPAGGNIAVQAVVPRPSPGNNSAIPGYAGLSLGNNSVLVAGQVPTPIMNSTPLGNFRLRRGDSTVQFAGTPVISGVSSAVRGNSTLPVSLRGANPPPTLGTNNVIIGHSGTPGRGKSFRALGSAPAPFTQSAQLGYSSLADMSQGARPAATSYVPPSPPCVNIAVLGSSGIPGQYQSAHLARPPHTPAYVAHPRPPTSCVTSAEPGRPGISANNVQGTFAGMHSPQFSSTGNSPATYTAKLPVPSVPLPETVATNPTQPPVPEVPVTNLITAPTQPPVSQGPSTNLVSPPKLSSAGLKKSARNRLRHLQNPPGTQVVATPNNMKPPSAAAPPVFSAVSSSASQASQAGNSVSVSYHPVVQLEPSENLSHVHAFSPALSSVKETAVPLFQSTPVQVSSKTTQIMGITVTGSQSPSTPVGRVEGDATQQGLTRQTREPVVATNSPHPGGVIIPPIARAQAQRKPLWMPKGDAGLFMGPLRNI